MTTLALTPDQAVQARSMTDDELHERIIEAVSAEYGKWDEECGWLALEARLTIERARARA